MNKLILSTVVCIGIFACTSPAENKEKDNLAIVKKYITAVESKDTGLMDFLLADNYRGYGPSMGDSTNKTDAIQNWKYNVENLYESIQYTQHTDLTVTVKEGKAIGDWVLNWAYLTIKCKDGRGPVYLWVNSVYKIENGRIVYSRTFYNEADALRQLGYKMVPPGSFE